MQKISGLPMIKFFMLLTLLACSTEKSTPVDEGQPERERIVIPTETEAQPIDPLKVQPCYCEKIFEPVCANGENYSNSCEAECHGHATWTDGGCTKK